MEINELIHRKGVERLCAAKAANSPSRFFHSDLAKGERKRIDASAAVIA